MLESVTAFAFNVRKDEWLKENRGIGFEEIIRWIDSDRLVDILPNANRHRYPDQYFLYVELNDYILMVPCMIEDEICFLKTAYFSRKATRKRRLNTRSDT